MPATLLNEAQIEALEGIEHYLEESGQDEFTAVDVRLAPATMRVLYNGGWLDQGSLWSNRNKYYRRSAKPIHAPAGDDELASLEDPYEVPRDLFDDIVGYESVKRWVLKTIRDRRRVHHCFTGPPASGKSLFLDEIERLPGAEWIQGAAATRAGINRLVLEQSPRFLLIDEADKMNPRSDGFSALLPLCETGRITETTHDRRIDRTFDTIVFLSCNDASKLPDAVRSRFRMWRFTTYEREEFIAVATAMLERREGRSLEAAAYIAEASWEHGARDVREPRAVARLCETREEIDAYLDSLDLAAAVR